jgi:L-malate glycosyltransferase
MPLRIAICLAHFHPMVGGAERAMEQLARRWARGGHRSFILTRAMPGLPRHEARDGLEIHREIRTLSLGPAFGASFIGDLTARLFQRRRQYDVIVAGQLPWEAVATGLAGRLLGKPSVALVASTGPQGDVQQILRAKGSRLLRGMVNRNSRLIALSSQGAEELRQLGAQHDRIVPLTNGVELERYRPAEEEPLDRRRTVLYVARLAPIKNPQMLLRAWRTVNRGGEYHLLIAGDGTLAGELKQFAVEEQLRKVNFLGQVDDVAAVHRRASVFVLPSASEGCSNALLEAMASGLCPVVTRVPGNIDVVRDETNGLLIDDERQLANALTRLLTDEPLRRRLATAARDHVVKHHDLDKIAASYIDLFAELIDNR